MTDRPSRKLLCEIICDLVCFKRPGEMSEEKREVINNYAAQEAYSHPELVRTLGDTQVPPGTMPQIIVGDDEE